MARWKLTIAYDGTEFKGWQKQPDQRTVQGELNRALESFLQAPVETAGQGRTDSGVHAYAQVAHVDLPGSVTGNRLTHAMKGLLPKDMALLSAEVVSLDFHARFHATSRRYLYQITFSPTPIKRREAWYVYHEPDLDVFKSLAGQVLGTHDFINFCIPHDDPMLTTTCTITESSWSYSDGLWRYHISGNRFLRHMVRRLVGSMVQAATGKISPEEFKKLLDGNEVGAKGHAAPSHGLILKEVIYS